MTTKIEQVAAAIRDAELTHKMGTPWLEHTARVAIQAMREPTDAMGTAFDEMDAWDDDTRLPTATEALNAMIDAALKEE